MGEGRGSAKARMVVGVGIILCMLALSHPTFAAVYSVGGAGGWTFNVQNWPSGKSFRAGDVVAFNYARSLHNVVAVSKAGYDSCRAPRGARVFQTGRDRIKLRKGPNYFICTFPGHCQGGMKVAINAS